MRHTAARVAFEEMAALHRPPTTRRNPDGHWVVSDQNHLSQIYEISTLTFQALILENRSDNREEKPTE